MRFSKTLHKPRKLTFFLIVVPLAVLFYWLGYLLTVYDGPQGQQFFSQDFAVIPVELDQQVPPANGYLPVQGLYRWTTCTEPCSFAARFEIPANPTAQDWGFVPSYNTDNFAVFVGGVRLAKQGRLLPEPSFHGKRSWLIRIPASLLHATQPTAVDLLLVRWAEPAAVNGAFIGPLAELETALASRFFMYYTWPRYLAVGGLVLGLIVLVALPLARHRRMFLWFAGVVISWALLSLYRLWFDFPFSVEIRALYYFMVLNLVYLSLFCFFDLWSGQNRFWQRLWAGVLYAGITVAYLIIGERLSAVAKEAWLGDPYQLLLSVVLLAKAVGHYTSRHEHRLIESAAVFVAITAALLDVLAQMFGIFDFYSLTRTLPVFVLAVAVSLYHRNVVLYESERSLNEVLQRELKLKEAELNESHQREQQVARAQILVDERQRILQDMHDGVGGRLAALLERQRAQPDADAHLTRELQQSLQDLLLIIDSLDPEVNQQLGSALGVLRSRVQPWLAAQGLTLIWQVELPTELGLGPEKTLHLYRCLQEAISNVVRHAVARTVTVSATLEDDWVELTIADDGQGFDAEQVTGGRGLSNMRHRMASMGGRLRIDTHGAPTHSATRVIFLLPISTVGARR